MAHPVPPHLVLHYQALGLRIGASFDEVQTRTQLIRRRFDGRSNLIKMRKAYEVLREARLASERPPPDSETVDHPSQSQEKTERYQLAPAGESVKPPLLHPSIQLQFDNPPPHPPRPDLSLHPKYQPQGGSRHQPSSQMSPEFAISYSQSNIFDAAEDRAVLVHAVNCQGVWGMGIAHQIKKRLPHAFEVYRNHCSEVGVGSIGHCLLIPPLPADYEVKDPPRVVFSPRLWVACLFTSTGYGKKNDARRNPGKDNPKMILGYTATALEELRMQLEAFGPTNFDPEENWKTDDEKPGRLFAVKLNSGAFEVPWERTEGLIQQVFAGFERPLHVFDPKVAPQPAKSNRRNEGLPWVDPESNDE